MRIVAREYQSVYENTFRRHWRLAFQFHVTPNVFTCLIKRESTETFVRNFAVFLSGGDIAFKCHATPTSLSVCDVADGRDNDE